MKTLCLFSACIVSAFVCSSVTFAFYSHGYVTADIDYEYMEIFPPEIACDQPVVKGDPNETECLPKITARLTYAFTEDTVFNATLLFYNIFNEIVGEVDIEEILRWEEGYVDFVDFVYIYPEYDFNSLQNSHHIKWEIHKQNNDETIDNK